MFAHIKSWRQSPRRRSGLPLVAASVAAALMVLAAIGVSLWQYRQEVEARALLIGRATVASVEGLLRAQFESYDSALRLVIANFADPNLRLLDDDVWQRLLSNIRDSDPGIRSITVIGPGGRVLAGQELQSDIGHTEAPFFSAHHASAGLGLLISDPAVGENGHHTVVLSRRITRSDGKFGGVAAIVVDLANVRRLLDPVPIGPMDSLTGSRAVARSSPASRLQLMTRQRSRIFPGTPTSNACS